MMDRRLFLSRAAVVAAGAVAFDQVELVEKLEREEEERRQPRRLFPGATFTEHRIAIAAAFFGERYIRPGDIIEVESTYPKASWAVKLATVHPEEKSRIVATWHNKPITATEILHRRQQYGARAGGW